MGIFSKEALIDEAERRECLAYYEEETKLRLLFERTHRMLDTRLKKWEDGYFAARRVRDMRVETDRKGNEYNPASPMEIMERIFEIRELMSQAATEIAERKKEMRPAPSLASAMSSAYRTAYLDYEAHSDPSNVVAGSNSLIVAAKREKAKQAFARFQRSLHQAWKEDQVFRKRLKLSHVEDQRIVANAEQAVSTDTWLQSLKGKLP